MKGWLEGEMGRLSGAAGVQPFYARRTIPKTTIRELLTLKTFTKREHTLQESIFILSLRDVLLRWDDRSAIALTCLRI